MKPPKSMSCCSKVENTFAHLLGGKQGHRDLRTKHSIVLAAPRCPKDLLMHPVATPSSKDPLT